MLRIVRGSVGCSCAISEIPYPFDDIISEVIGDRITSYNVCYTKLLRVVDSLATIVQGTRCVLYVWYDNEYGYSSQVVRLVQKMAGLELPLLPF